VAQDEYDRETSVVYFGPSSTVAVLMTAAYAALQGGYDLVNPELSGVAGFDQAWELPVAASVPWSANRMGWHAGVGDRSGASGRRDPADGNRRRRHHAVTRA
jgi:hypothetical protein